MPRKTTLATAAIAAVTAVTASAPVWADESYERQHVRSNPEKGSPQHVTLDVPAGWERDRLNRVSVGFFHYDETPASVVVDLDPVADTVEETRAEARSMRRLGDAYYKELDFRVNDEDDKVRVRWVYAYRDAQTGDTWSYTSVYLIGDERLVIDGRRSDKEQLQEVRRHAVSSFEFQE